MMQTGELSAADAFPTALAAKAVLADPYHQNTSKIKIVAVVCVQNGSWLLTAQ